jgi:hypothetical protein
MAGFAFTNAFIVQLHTNIKALPQASNFVAPSSSFLSDVIKQPQSKTGTDISDLKKVMGDLSLLGGVTASQSCGAAPMTVKRLVV